MLILEYKLRVNQRQRAAIDEAIRTTQFIRNKCLRLWMETRGTGDTALQASSAQLAQDFPFAAQLNSMARQAAADRAWAAISRFYKNCQEHKPGTQASRRGQAKGYPRFQKDNRSVEYKTSGWKLEPDGKYLTQHPRARHWANAADWQTEKIETFPLAHIKRVRILKRADGYYVPFAVQTERTVTHEPTGRQVGIDVGLKAFYTDSDGVAVPNPRFLRKRERTLKRLHRRVSKKQKRSKNRKKAIQRQAYGYLKVSRQRKDFAVKAASALVRSSDLIAYEDVRMANLVKNHHLAKSINDAAWGQFLSWLRSYGAMANVPVGAVSPKFTTQDCSGCSERVKKSLGVANPCMPSVWSGAGSGRERGPQHSLSCLGLPGSTPYRRAGGNGSLFGAAQRFWTEDR